MLPDLPPRPHLVAEAAAAHDALVRAAVDDLDAVTPCAGWTARDLVSHLLTWTPVLADAGRGLPREPVSADVDGGAVALLERDRDDLVAVWGTAGAWRSPTSVAGTPLPGTVVGTMVLAELVLHAWDLARATGTPAGWSERLLVEVHDALEALTPLGRGMGAFGPPVPVADDASPLDRVVAVAGRDPSAGLTISP